MLHTICNYIHTLEGEGEKVETVEMAETAGMAILTNWGGGGGVCGGSTPPQFRPWDC